MADPAGAVIVEAVGLGTVASDARWRFYYDPLRVLALNVTQRLEVLVSDWVHEVGHLLREHAQRWTDLGQPLHWHPVFNMAGDALINHDLAELGLTILPTDVTFQRLPTTAEAAPTMTTEEIYQRLRKAATPRADVVTSNRGAESSSPNITVPLDEIRDCGSCAAIRNPPTAADAPLLADLISELIDWQLAEYLSRASASRSVVNVIRNASDRPILMLLRDENPGLPSERDVPVHVDLGWVTFDFMKVAVNVARREGAGANLLPDLLEHWFGTDAGTPGAHHRVALWHERDGWHAAPVRVEGAVAEAGTTPLS